MSYHHRRHHDHRTIATHATTVASRVHPHPPEMIDDTNANANANARRTRKAVTFKPTCAVRVFHARDGDDDVNKSKLYYSVRELEVMNLEANALCMLSKYLPELTSSRDGGGSQYLDRRDSIIKRGSYTSTCVGGVGVGVDATSYVIAPDTSRGLEMALYPMRYKTKVLALRALLQYQETLNGTGASHLSAFDRMAALSAAYVKLTSWSKLVALETGRWDALRAYDAREYPISIGGGMPDAANIASCPFPFCVKERGRKQRKLPPREGEYDGRERRRSSSGRVTPDVDAGGKRRKI